MRDAPRLHRYLPEAAASLQAGAKHCGQEMRDASAIPNPATRNAHHDCTSRSAWIWRNLCALMDAIATPATVDSQAPGAQDRPAVWGLVATILWSVLIGVVFLVAQFFVLAVYILVTIGDPGDQIPAVLRQLEFDGTFLSFTTFANVLVCVPVIMGIAKLKRGSNLKDYLGLRWPALGQVLRWSLITLVLCFL